MMSSSQVNSWRVKTQSKPLRTKHIASTCNISHIFHVSILCYLQLTYHRIYGSFTLPDAETETDTDKMCIEPNGHLNWSIFLSIMNNSTGFYTSYFLSVSVSVLVSGGVNTPSVRTNYQRIEFSYLGCSRLENVIAGNVIENDDSEHTYHKWEDNRD